MSRVSHRVDVSALLFTFCTRFLLLLCLLWLLAGGLQPRVEVRVKSASTFACEPSIKHVTFLPSPSSTSERTTYLFDFLSNPWTTPPVFPLRIVFMIQGVPVSKNSCLAPILTFSSLPALPTMQIYFPVFFTGRRTITVSVSRQTLGARSLAQKALPFSIAAATSLRRRLSR